MITQSYHMQLAHNQESHYYYCIRISDHSNQMHAVLTSPHHAKKKTHFALNFSQLPNYALALKPTEQTGMPKSLVHLGFSSEMIQIQLESKQHDNT